MDLNSAIPPAAGTPASGIAGFDAVAAAPAYTPLPPGVYTALAEHGEACTTRAGGDAYRMRFRVTDGEHANKTVTRVWTFGPKALPYTKRDLAPFGLATQTALLSPFPPVGREYRVRLVVALRRDNDGTEHADIKRIEVLGVTDSPVADFALPTQPEEAPK